MKWICYTCGNEFSSPSDERYTVLSAKFKEPTPGNCKECHDAYELQTRADLVILATGVSTEIAIAYAKAERTHFIATGQEVDIVQVLHKTRLIGPSIGVAFDAQSVLSMRLDSLGKIGDKLNFDIKPIRLDNEPSKYFGKSKRNYRK